LIEWEHIHFEGNEEFRRRDRKLRQNRLATDNDKVVIDYVDGSAQRVLELFACHADARSSTARTRRRRSCSVNAPPKGDDCLSSRSRG
jgi:hypothetical protein